MKQVTLPYTDINASAICLGASNFGATIPQADAFALMDTFVEQGGNFLDTAADYANAHDCHGFVANQPMWSLAQPNPAAFGMPGLAAMDAAMFAFHQACGWAVIPYTSQARGFFGKVAAQGATGLSERDRQAYWNAENERRATIVQQLAQEYSATPTQIALAYLICQPTPTIPVIGCRTLSHLQDSLGADAISLPATAIALLGAYR